MASFSESLSMRPLCVDLDGTLVKSDTLMDSLLILVRSQPLQADDAVGAFSTFLFLSLAIVKRFSELQNVRATGASLTNGRGYLLADVEQLRIFGTGSGIAAVVVFARYINGGEIAHLYKHPQRMWLIMPLLILWVFRVWLLASRGQLDEDAVIFAVTDRVSLLICLTIAVIAAFATV